MRIRVDINESIKSNRLKVTHKNYCQILDALAFIVVSLLSTVFCAVFPAFLTIEGALKGSLNIIPFLIFGAPVIFLGLLSFYALVSDNRLTKFKGINEELNREHLKEVLREKFGVISNNSEGQIFRIYKKATIWKFGVRVVVIFKEDDVYINISRFNYRGLKSPFHPLFDAIKVRSIIKQFHKKIKYDGSVQVNLHA